MTTTAIGIGQDAIAYHDRLAINWEARYRKDSFGSRLAALAECLKDRELEGAEWVDAGCGTGTMSRWLAGRACSVLGVDAAPQMVETAAALARSGDPRGSLRFELVETIARLPLASHSADGILCSSVLEYVPDPAACLVEFARVLRPEGTLVVSVPNADSFIRRLQIICKRSCRLLGRDLFPYLKYSKHQYSRAQFERLIISQGFQVDKVVVLGGPIPRWAQRTSLSGSLLMFSATRTQRLLNRKSSGLNALSAD